MAKRAPRYSKALHLPPTLPGEGASSGSDPNPFPRKKEKLGAFSAFLKKKREALGVSAWELARRLGVHRSWLYTLESLPRGVYPSTIRVELLEALEVSPREWAEVTRLACMEYAMRIPLEVEEDKLSRALAANNSPTKGGGKRVVGIVTPPRIRITKKRKK